MIGPFTPRTAGGIATVCQLANVLTLVGGGTILIAAYGLPVKTQALIFSAPAILLGWGLHYLAACGATRHKRRKAKP